MEKLCLNGKWTLLQSGQDKKMDAIVPGNVHLDLMNAGVINDPFVADNDKIFSLNDRLALTHQAGRCSCLADAIGNFIVFIDEKYCQIPVGQNLPAILMAA